MCFLSNKAQKSRTAKRNIYCWKYLNTDNTNGFSHLPHIPIILYEKGKKASMILFPDSILIGTEIHRGYHSYRTAGLAELFKEDLNIADSCVLKKFVIPVGTGYFLNNTEYVSETIMLVE